MENGSVKLKTNKRKGNYGEMKMDVHFENQGYTRLNKDRVTSLDDVKTVFDPKASFMDKGVAIFSVTPAGKALKAGRLGLKFVQKTPAGKLISPKKVDLALKSTGKRPPNLTPEGAGRAGAFKEAKRNSGIPVTQHPKKVTPAVDRRGNRIPGRDYDYGDGKVIRDHSGGHKFPDDPSQNRGPHFNDVKGEHYDYVMKQGR